jgi:hypothetical protein
MQQRTCSPWPMTPLETAQWVKECQGFTINLHQMGITISLTTRPATPHTYQRAITYATRTSQIKPATILRDSSPLQAYSAGSEQGSSDHDQGHQRPATPQKPLKNPPPQLYVFDITTGAVHPVANITADQAANAVLETTQANVPCRQWMRPPGSTWRPGWAMHNWT